MVFLDTEFTDLLDPQLLSLGMVTLDGREHYVELDLDCAEGVERTRSASQFVRAGVFDLWGLVPGARCRWWEMGRRTAEWLLALPRPHGRLEVAFDYQADYALMEEAIRNAGLWDPVRDVVRPVNVDRLTGSIEGELAAEGCFSALRGRGLRRHHALADALALRAAYLAIKKAGLGRRRGI